MLKIKMKIIMWSAIKSINLKWRSKFVMGKEKVFFFYFGEFCRFLLKIIQKFKVIKLTSALFLISQFHLETFSAFIINFFLSFAGIQFVFLMCPPKTKRCARKCFNCWWLFQNKKKRILNFKQKRWRNFLREILCNRWSFFPSLINFLKNKKIVLISF